MVIEVRQRLVTIITVRFPATRIVAPLDTAASLDLEDRAVS